MTKLEKSSVLEWAYQQGVEAAEAKYRPIVEELVKALEEIVEIDVQTHKRHPEYEGQWSEYADVARQALESVRSKI